jgi:hypothetical protein
LAVVRKFAQKSQCKNWDFSKPTGGIALPYFLLGLAALAAALAALAASALCIA